MSTTTAGEPQNLGTVRTARSRGALAGLLLVLLGFWGAFVPFVGPYFGYGFTPTVPWVFTWGRFWLEILPGIATVVGGVILCATANRASAHVGGVLATAAGAWYVVGAPVWSLIFGDPAPLGVSTGGIRAQALEQIGVQVGLGAVIVLLAALALGRFSVRGVRDVAAGRDARDRAEQRRREREGSPAWSREGGGQAPTAAVPTQDIPTHDDTARGGVPRSP